MDNDKLMQGGTRFRGPGERWRTLESVGPIWGRKSTPSSPDPTERNTARRDSDEDRKTTGAASQAGSRQCRRPEPRPENYNSRAARTTAESNPPPQHRPLVLCCTVGFPRYLTNLQTTMAVTKSEPAAPPPQPSIGVPALAVVSGSLLSGTTPAPPIPRAAARTPSKLTSRRGVDQAP